MPLAFSCPLCRRRISVSRSLAGQRGKCPGCAQVIAIPARRDPSADLSETALTNTMSATLGAPASPSLDLTGVTEELAVAKAELDLAIARHNAPATTTCEACAEEIKAAAKVCKHCGHIVGERVARPKRGAPEVVPPRPPGPDPHLALILTAALGPAIGWWYAGGCAMAVIGLACGAVIYVLAAAAAQGGAFLSIGVFLGGHLVCAVAAQSMCQPATPARALPEESAEEVVRRSRIMRRALREDAAASHRWELVIGFVALCALVAFSVFVKLFVSR